MKLSLPHILICSGLALVGSPYATRAAAVLDQEYTATTGGSGNFSNVMTTFRRAETFTVGVAGTLSEIDIFFVATGSFTGMNILSTVSAVPTTTVVASGSLQSTAAGVAVFTTSLPVTIGEVLALEPISTAFQSPGWTNNNPGTYPGGQDYFINPAVLIDSFTPSGVADNFRTFVTPRVVPLPAALPLFATGLGALALLGWRRQRKL